MSKVIPFPPGGDSPVLATEPLAFVEAWWHPAVPLMTDRRCLTPDLVMGPGAAAPDGLDLEGGPARTLLALFRLREQADLMTQVYFLAGLMELTTRLRHEVLRTDLLRRVFKEIDRLATQLGLRWSAGTSQFLLPIELSGGEAPPLETILKPAATLKALLAALRAETDRQLARAGRDFVFFVPSGWPQRPA